MQSGHDLVTGQTPQAHGIAGPVVGRIGGDAPVVVEVYALNRGVTLVGQGSNLLGREGTFELEANGKIFVFDPIGACQAHGFVAPVKGDVTAILQPLQTVDQEDLAELGQVVGHSRSPLKTAILALPQGYGKNIIAAQLAERLGCITVVDEWHPREALQPGALHLTNDDMVVGAA
jgi:hypothetical protein